jgi:hypothetical protein
MNMVGGSIICKLTSDFIDICCSGSDRWHTLIIIVMKIRRALVPGSITVGRRIGDISHEACKRLKWFDYYHSHWRNARLT